MEGREGKDRVGFVNGKVGLFIVIEGEG